MRILLSVLLIMLVNPLAAFGQYSEELGPEPGQTVPYAVAAHDQSGTARDFASLTGDKGAVLVFFRSASWCPFCQNQLKGLEARRNEIEAQGYSLVGVSYDSVADLAAFSDANGIGFPLLADEGSAIIEGFGILNTEVNPKSRAYGIPYPMLIVVGADGTVQAKLSEESYRDRPEVDALLTAIQRIG